MSNLMLHCGAVNTTLSDLESVETPEKTKSYTPLPHSSLIGVVREAVRNTKPNWVMESEEYGLDKKGSKLFGVHTYHREHSEDNGLSIGFRHSHDRHMAVAGAAGLQVFVCDNMSFLGETAFRALHRGDDLLGSVYQHFCTIIQGAEFTAKKITADFDSMKKISVDDNTAYEMTGLLEGHKILNNKRKKIVLHDWNVPRHKEFEPRNLYSYYNCVTESLKHVPVGTMPNFSQKSHELIMDRYVDNCVFKDGVITPN